MEINGQQVKRGFKFTHQTFLDYKNQPLQCEVTKVTKTHVYWKRVGASKAEYFTRIENFKDDVNL